MSAIVFIECLYEYLMWYHTPCSYYLVGMGAPVAYYNNRHLVMMQFVQKQNYKIASLHSKTL